jgi:hypothetical protein
LWIVFEQAERSVVGPLRFGKVARAFIGDTEHDGSAAQIGADQLTSSKRPEEVREAEGICREGRAWSRERWGEFRGGRLSSGLGQGKRRFAAARGDVCKGEDLAVADQQCMVEVINGGADMAWQQEERFSDLRTWGARSHC